MIAQGLWETYIPGEVPEGITYRMFSAAREAMWEDEDLQHNIMRLQELRMLWVKASDEFKRLIELEARQIKELL